MTYTAIDARERSEIMAFLRRCADKTQPSNDRTLQLARALPISPAAFRNESRLPPFDEVIGPAFDTLTVEAHEWICNFGGEWRCWTAIVRTTGEPIAQTEWRPA